MVLLLGLTRVVFAMSRDGLLPRGISRTSHRYHTPIRLQVGVGIVVALIAGLSQVELLEEMINIGTLSAFVLVSFGIPILRRSRPDLQRSFKVPWSPVLPIVSGVACLWLMANLTTLTWLRFLGWVVVGLVIYAFYGYRHSVAARDTLKGDVAA
jgi:APA family basic amino acid/polyamine antiporter